MRKSLIKLKNKNEDLRNEIKLLKREILSYRKSGEIVADYSRRVSRLSQELELKTEKLEKAEYRLRNWNRELNREVKERTKQLKKALRKIKKQMMELQELDKMKGEFLNITSHELRTPITPIKAQLQLLLEKSFGNLNNKQERSLRMILKNANRLDLLVLDIIDACKLQSGWIKLELTNTQLNDVVLNSIRQINKLAKEKQITVKTKLTKLPKILIDKYRVRQVLINVLNNAIKFTNLGGKVLIETKKEKNALLVQVRDTGIGIAEENLKKLFEPFQQLEPSKTRKHGGTGLGLYICKGIIELHKGKIWVESELGKGSIFYFSLPIKKKRFK